MGEGERRGNKRRKNEKGTQLHSDHQKRPDWFIEITFDPLPLSTQIHMTHMLHVHLTKSRHDIPEMDFCREELLQRLRQQSMCRHWHVFTDQATLVMGGHAGSEGFHVQLIPYSSIKNQLSRTSHNFWLGLPMIRLALSDGKFRHWELICIRLRVNKRVALCYVCQDCLICNHNYSCKLILLIHMCPWTYMYDELDIISQSTFLMNAATSLKQSGWCSMYRGDRMFFTFSQLTIHGS